MAITGRVPDPAVGSSDDDIVAFATWLSLSYAPSTVAGYISMGPRLLHQVMGWPWQTASDRYLVKLTMNGFKRARAEVAPPTANRKLPITIQMLTSMAAHVRTDDLTDQAVWAAIQLGFLCLLRKGHLCAKGANTTDAKKLVRWGDITADAENGGRLRLDLDRTKTIQYKERKISIFIPDLSGHATLDFKATLQAYAQQLSERGMVPTPDTPLFIQTSRTGSLEPLKYDNFIKRLKELIKLAGYDPAQYAGHSLRRGGATFLRELGFPDEVIDAMGDWAPGGSARYYKIPSATVCLRAAVGMEQALRPQQQQQHVAAPSAQQLPQQSSGVTPLVAQDAASAGTSAPPSHM